MIKSTLFSCLVLGSLLFPVQAICQKNTPNNSVEEIAPVTLNILKENIDSMKCLYIDRQDIIATSYSEPFFVGIGLCNITSLDNTWLTNAYTNKDEIEWLWEETRNSPMDNPMLQMKR